MICGLMICAETSTDTEDNVRTRTAKKAPEALKTLEKKQPLFA